MSSVSLAERSAAWNVEFIDHKAGKVFAGLFQADDMLTYGDAFKELNLCFKFDRPDELMLWRVNPNGLLNEDVCIYFDESNERPIRLASPATSEDQTPKTRFVFLRHPSEACGIHDVLDFESHVDGILGPLKSLKSC